MKNLNAYLKSASFKASEKYKLKYFCQVEKIFVFFHLPFSSSFSNSLKIFISFNSSTQNYLFNEVLLLIISFYLQEQLTKMYGLPIFLKQSLSKFNSVFITWQILSRFLLKDNFPLFPSQLGHHCSIGKSKFKQKRFGRQYVTRIFSDRQRKLNIRLYPKCP